MQIHQLLLPRASGCVQCTSQTPVCNCPTGQQCVQIGQSCSQCIHYECVAPSSSSSGGGISTGAVVGIVIAIVIIAALSVFGFLYWRRRQQAKIAAEKAKTTETKDVPAPAETVLRRPDPSEKAPPPSPRLMALAQAAQQKQQQQFQQPTNVRMYDNGTSVIDLDPATYGQAHGGDSRSSQNPFVDSQSIITTSTGSQQTNVIPIALVPPGTLSPVHSSHSSSPGGHRSSAVTSATTASSSLSSLQPPRPIHSPNMDHLDVSRDPSLAAAGGSTTDLPQPRRNSGNSYLTNASFASDLDAVIVTQSSRQVLGVAVGNAAVIRTPPVRSPLAMAYTAPSPSSSVPPSPSARSAGFEDPFNDAHHAQMRGSESGHGDEHLDARSSRATFGTTLGSIAPEDANPPSMPHYTPPVAGSAARRERPVSNLTQAASVIGAEVVGATRVHLDYTSPMSSPRSPLSSPGANSVSSVGVFGRQNSVKRMTAARLVAPASPSAMQQRHDQQQQQQQQQERATREVQAARAAAQERAELTPPNGMLVRRNSSETMASAISARADSILESFTFVPPSPISNRPPRSPLAAEHQQHGRYHQAQAEAEEQLVPPNRKMLGMSTGSELSNVSTGLGSYSFEIDRGSGVGGGVATNGNGGHGSGSGRGKTRASLDTLALTSDLASYPLGFDRPPMP